MAAGHPSGFRKIHSRGRNRSTFLRPTGVHILTTDISRMALSEVSDQLEILEHIAANTREGLMPLDRKFPGELECHRKHLLAERASKCSSATPRMRTASDIYPAAKAQAASLPNCWRTLRNSARLYRSTSPP